MPSSPFARLRRAAAASPAVAALLLPMLGACSSAPPAAGAAAAAAHAAPARLAAHDLSWSTTFEVRFDGELVGYLVDVGEVPEGIVDARPWEPGTALIEDARFELIGFISPRGKAYRFDEDNVAMPVQHGSRDADIAAFFKRSGKPLIVAPFIGG